MEESFGKNLSFPGFEELGQENVQTLLSKVDLMTADLRLGTED